MHLPAEQKSKSTKRRKEAEAKADAAPKLTADEKADLCNQAVEALQDAIEKVGTAGRLLCAGGHVFSLWHEQPSMQPTCLAACANAYHCCNLQTKTDGEKDVDDIRTLMEEVDIRIKETKQGTYEFKRDIILGERKAS